MPAVLNSAGRLVEATPVRLVTGLTDTDERGRPVPAMPVRFVNAIGATSHRGLPVDAVPVVVTSGLTALVQGRQAPVRPVRIVAGLTTTDHRGQIVPVVPIYIGAANFSALLGASLNADWDAGTESSVARSGSLISAWTDLHAGLAPAQAVGISKPLYTVLSTNGRPAVGLDGIDDFLRFDGVNSLQTGSVGSELHVLVEQLAPNVEAGARAHFTAGGLANAGQRAARRGQAGGVSVSRASVTDSVGLQNADGTSAFNGVHLQRIRFEPTQTLVYVDGVLERTLAVVPATLSGRITIGANNSDVPSAFGLCRIQRILATGLLSSDQATLTNTILKSIGSIA